MDTNNNNTIKDKKKRQEDATPRKNHEIFVSSEIGNLRRLIVHRPDDGIGTIIPKIKDDLLYDDIVHFERMRNEYDEYLEVLLWFLDPEAIRRKPKSGTPEADAFFTPTDSNYVNSDKVIDVERLLIRVLNNQKAKTELVVSIVAIENGTFELQKRLERLCPESLARVLISGVLVHDNGEQEFLFPPIPNFIFTRDIGIVIKDHLLLSRAHEPARKRESILAKYIAYYELFKDREERKTDNFSDKIIELSENDRFFLLDAEEKKREIVTIEGGDVMMIAPDHLLIGLSERTSVQAMRKVALKLFEKDLVSKITAVQIPPRRDYMHIDTVFTQVRHDMWVVFDKFAKAGQKEAKQFFKFNETLTKQKKAEVDVRITQFRKKDNKNKKGFTMKTAHFDYLEDLFEHISKEDFGAKSCQIIYCGGGKFPYSEREQWTDACNFLALREGVIIGYDRNIKTMEEFEKHGFTIMHSADFIAKMEKGKTIDEVITGDTMIVLPSGELSRARGGSHCMSMPLLRDPFGSDQ
ncbi:MAG: amidinotransferase [Bernardetiaceae bacterium]|nr:amidinotransferase [Bernardetiaceae bacterium]